MLGWIAIELDNIFKMEKVTIELKTVKFDMEEVIFELEKITIDMEILYVSQ